MENLILDAALVGRLILVKQPVQLCTPDGQVLGQFTPIGAPDAADGRPFISAEELHKRITGKGGRTWAEIKADLEKRG
jgi:hypothetical protein